MFRPAYLPVVLLVLLLVFPVFAGNPKIFDQQAHRDFARTMQREGRLVTPHFGYHLTLLTVNALIPRGNLKIAAVTVNIAAYVIAGVLCFRYLYGRLVDHFAPGRENRAQWLATGLTGLAVLVGPPVMLSWYLDFRLNGYIIYNQFHSPTQSVVLPLAIGLFMLAVCLLLTGQLTRLKLVGLAVLALAAPLTKPNFSMVLVPALGLVTRLVRRQPVAWRALLLTVAVPTLLVLGWQYSFTYLQQTVIGYGINERNGILFAPLRTALYFDPQVAVIALKLLVSLALPLWMLAFFPPVRRDPVVRLLWLMVVIGLAQYLLLSESGEFYMAANFNWGLRMAAHFLVVVSLLHLVQAALPKPQRHRLHLTPSLIGAGVLLTLHLIGGLHLYYGYASRMIPTLP